MAWEELGLTALIVTGAPIVWRTLRGMVRGHFATDIVATLSIVTAVLLREPIAGLVIVLMQSGGELLEKYAAKRASRAIEELEDARPHVAHRIVDGSVQDIAAEHVGIGDLLALRPGELVPVDGVVTEGESWVDASKLTGESVPVDVAPRSALLSGSVVGDRPLTMRATARADQSQYSKIVDLVRSAQSSKAPLQRLADKYAMWFTPITLIVCAIAFALTGSWSTVLAVLVVATPCPLILATPVAIVGGISHAARHGIIVRHGGALEGLSRVTAAVFDKTGTLTVGRPAVHDIVARKDWDLASVVRLAASVEQGSGHSLARSIVEEAYRRNGNGVTAAHSVVETPGRGVRGVVGQHRVAVGSRAFVIQSENVKEDSLASFEQAATALRAFVVVDGSVVGAIDFADRVRPGVRTTFERLQRAGIRRTLLLSGDNPEYVRRVAAEVGIQDASGNLLPADKVASVAQLEHEGERVLMVGDGVNDAPALSRATIGVALAAHGRGIASESADVILLEDDLESVAEAVEIGRKAMRVARQSILVGLGLSSVAMLFAAFGYIPPVVGAALQEGIDVAVIVNALRTSR